MKEYEFHELATLVPPMPPAEFADLKAAIKARGLRRPIVLYDEKILDGRNRYSAIKELLAEGVTKSDKGTPIEVAVIRKDFRNDEEAAYFVADENLFRRHLTKEQVIRTIPRLYAAFEGPAKERSAKNLNRGADDANSALQESAESPTSPRDDVGKTRQNGRSVERVAKVAGVSPKTVERVVAVEKKGTPALKEAVAKGEIKPKPAAEIAKLPPAEQDAAVAKARGEEPPANPDAPIFPADVREWFEPLRETMDRHQRNVGALRNWLRELGDLDEPRPGERCLHQDAKEIGRKLDDVYTFLKTFKPHAVCPACLGTGRMRNDKCSTCKGDRVVNEMQWNASTSEDKARVYVVR